MTKSPSIATPAGYAPTFALGYSDPQSQLSVVSESQPLPVRLEQPRPGAPLAGEAASALVAGPFEAKPGLPITVTLQGQWSGSVSLLRSIDAGATRLPLLAGGTPWGVFTSSGCEQVWVESEAGVTFYLDIAITSGALAYRVSQ